MPNTLESLPTELLTAVAEAADSNDLLALRLTSRRLRDTSEEPFGTAFFTIRKHIISRHSLQGLVEITAHPTFGQYVRTVMIGATRITMAEFDYLLNVVSQTKALVGWLDPRYLDLSGFAFRSRARDRIKSFISLLQGKEKAVVFERMLDILLDDVAEDEGLAASENYDAAKLQVLRYVRCCQEQEELVTDDRSDYLEQAFRNTGKFGKPIMIGTWHDCDTEGWGWKPFFGDIKRFRAWNHEHDRLLHMLFQAAKLTACTIKGLVVQYNGWPMWKDIYKKLLSETIPEVLTEIRSETGRNVDIKIASLLPPGIEFKGHWLFVEYAPAEDPGQFPDVKELIYCDTGLHLGDMMTLLTKHHSNIKRFEINNVYGGDRHQTWSDVFRWIRDNTRPNQITLSALYEGSDDDSVYEILGNRVTYKGEHEVKEGLTEVIASLERRDF